MKKNLFYTLLLGILSGLGSYAHESNSMKGPSLPDNFSDSLRIYSHTIKKNTIKLFPNPTSSGKLTVVSNSNDYLYFYVFDLEATLIHQFILKAKEKVTIDHLKKGVYTYDVFKNDESIEQGKIMVQ